MFIHWELNILRALAVLTLQNASHKEYVGIHKEEYKLIKSLELLVLQSLCTERCRLCNLDKGEKKSYSAKIRIQFSQAMKTETNI